MDKKLEQQTIAQLKLSGTPVIVGLDQEGPNGSPWFQTDDNPEPVYMSSSETKLLIAALQAAVDLNGET